MHEDKNYEIDQILQEMRSDYWRNLEISEDDVGSSGDEFLVICYGSKRYALPAASCREVLKLPRLIRVPRLPDHLRGIFNLRGEIVAVTDLRPLLGHEKSEVTDGFRLVVVESGPIKTALLVEAVEGLTKVDNAQVEPLAEGAGSGVRDLIRGKLVEGEQVLVLLDLSRLLARPELIVDQKEQASSGSD